MRTLQEASWWLIFGQPSPLKMITSSSSLANISEREPPPLSKAERNPKVDHDGYRHEDNATETTNQIIEARMGLTSMGLKKNRA